ncbi:GNAT family N-acetyltransferase [Microbacterium sp. NPDC057407]|uniref:GNAT family N-acetyltransferase n=1 Tax=Microbacterium sp. NPDC057407 TaxID=3346120 RepID=UPI0036709C08
MAAAPEPEIRFRRLTEVATSAVRELLNEPRNARHMPLAGRFDDAQTAEWVRAKDAQWEENGYGPWAVFLDGEFAGWGGFQREDAGPDFGLVLFPAFWGAGADIARAAFAAGFDELGFDEISVALPYSRTPGDVMARWGFDPVEDGEFDGVRFRRYRLARDAWARSALIAPRDG